MSQYRTEKALSQDFERYLKTNFGSAYYKEWSGLFGIPDYVCFCKHSNNIKVISFELKLTNWRRALVQAFRYRSFSHLSYVVMPEDTIANASLHTNEFKQYGIGLLSFGKTGLHTVCDAFLTMPYSPQLSNKVIDKVKKSRKTTFTHYSNVAFI